MDGANPKMGPPLSAAGVSFLLDVNSEVLVAHREGISSVIFSTSCSSLGSYIRKPLVFTPGKSIEVGIWRLYFSAAM